ncbi:dephospho-CoA kinase [Massilibacterium senegalense]|uniref:dephospho-CoA kinase n=1 Tax=Massilibacterium senegalense TaxID=1632858 RepID=UPI00093E2C00|nr:dephospho-CoA kinase [Massilibacterium senegalense]
MTKVVGITGGIASGKSTVVTMLKEMKFPIIDADLIAREVVRVGEEAYEKIVEHFGSDILLEDHTINRAKLGEIVFNNEKERLALNAIVHPAVRKRMNEKKEKWIAAGESVIFLDIPLLFESKLTNMVEKVLLIYVDEETQVERLMERNDFTQEQARSRIASQMQLKEKKTLSDAVIDNNGSVENTKTQLLEILRNWDIIDEN